MDQTMLEHFDTLESLIRDYAGRTEVYVKSINDKIAELEARVDTVAADSKQMRDSLDVSMRVLDKLINDKKAVLQQDAYHVALDSRRVTDAAHKERMARTSLLREWDAADRLCRDVEDGKTRYTKKVTVAGERIRAVVVIKILN